MGLFSFTKSQLLKSLEWSDDSKNTLVYKYPPRLCIKLEEKLVTVLI